MRTPRSSSPILFCDRRECRDTSYAIERIFEMILTVFSRIHYVCWQGELRSPSQVGQSAVLQIGTDKTHREIPRTTVFENVLKAEPADVRRQGGSNEVGKARAVPGEELRPPVDVDVVGAEFRPAGRIG